MKQQKNMDMKYMKSIFILTFFLFTTSIAFGEPQDIKGLLESAKELVVNGQFDDAIITYDKVLFVQPNNTDALLGKGVALANLDKYNDSLSYFDKVLETDPNNVHALNNKAAALIKLQKQDQALPVLEKVLKIDPQNVVALSNKRVALYNETAVSTKGNTQDNISVFWQLQIYNSNHQLVGYIESNRIVIPDYALLNAVLDTDTTLEKTIIEKDGKKFEEFTLTEQANYAGKNVVATETGYTKEGQWLIYAFHNGFQISNGDLAMEKWTIIRPLR